MVYPVTDNSIITGAANLSKDASKKFVEKILEKTESVSLASKMKKGISDIVGGLVKDGVKGGLNKLFGNIFQSSVDTKNFDVNLTLQTQIELTGTSEFPSVAQIVPLNNINIKTYNGGNNLGVWNIEKTPKVTYNKYSPVAYLYSYGGGGPHDPSIPVSAEFLVYVPEIEFEKPDIIINPSIQKYLKKQSVYYELISCLSPHNKTDYTNKYRMDLLSFMASDESGTFERLYSNKETDMHVYGLKSFSYFEEIYQSVEGYYKKNYNYVYDWSSTKDDTFILVVTVDQTFEFNGKEIQITSSKHFKTDFAMRADWYYIYPTESGFGPSYVINKDQVLR